MLGMKTGYQEAGKMVINSVDPGGLVVKNPPASAGDMGSILSGKIPPALEQ